MREHENGQLPLAAVRAAHGCWLELDDGRRLVDGISSWWTNLFGHGDRRIVDAIANQAARLDHVLLAGFTHSPAVDLAEALLAVAPAGLSRVFYADNGSAAVEVALKMAFHAAQNRGESRDLFVALRHGYHGETLGALAVGDVALYRATYAPLLHECRVTASPCVGGGAEPAERDVAGITAVAELTALLEAEGTRIAALILEPMLQCAGGMRMGSAEFLRSARALCDQHGVALIADEIATGFGRTGRMFALDHAGVSPDLLCLSKGLTGGALPLAAVLTTDDIYQAFLDDRVERAFLHSHSYTGNPIACAAARATLRIFSGEDVLGGIAKLGGAMADRAQILSGHAAVANVRQIGPVVAFDLVDHKGDPCGRPSMLAGYRAALASNALLRPLGSSLYWMPPYCIDEPALDQLLAASRAFCDAAAASGPR